jgi:hypothetical protein
MTALGKNQMGMLLLLELHGGFWHDGCGWVNVNRSNTERLLATLESRGRVTSEPYYGSFRVYRKIEDLPFDVWNA